MKGIAITGIGGRLPGAQDLGAFWRNLVEGVGAIRTVPAERWQSSVPDRGDVLAQADRYFGGFIADADCFDAAFFRISPKEAELIDPQQRLLLEVAWHTLEDARVRPSALAGHKVGVFIGATSTDYCELLSDRRLLETGLYASTGTSPSILSNRISFFFDFHGPSLTVDTACSSSLVAIHLAAHSILRGECESALAGGVNICWTPGRFLAFGRAGMLSKDGRCKTFDAGANGYVRGEGVGLVMLKPLEQAQRDGDRIHGVIRGSAINHGGRTNGLTVTSPQRQSELLADAYREAGFSPKTVGYIEVHGTGTSLGDPIEFLGLESAFREMLASRGEDAAGVAYCALGSVKTSIGHLEAAAGVAGLIKVLLAMKHRCIPGNLNLVELNPLIEVEGTPFYVPTAARAWSRVVEDGVEVPRRAGISSFGYGGAYSHLVVEEYEPPGAPADDEPPSGDEPCLLVLSAHSRERLIVWANAMADFLSATGDPAPRLRDVAYSLQVTREEWEERAAFTVPDIETAVRQLRTFVSSRGEAGAACVGSAKKAKRADGPKRVPEGSTLAALAREWVEGAPVDWASLYGSRVPARISLPLYPFVRQRYWAPEPDARPAELGNATLHPLLHRNTSNLTRQRFSAQLAGTESFIRDHVVRGSRMLPGVCYLEMAREAMALSWDGDIAGPANVELRDVVWLRPVLADEPKALHIGLRPGRSGEIEFDVSSEPPQMRGAPGESMHARGVAAIVSGPRELGTVDVAAVRTRCSGAIDADRCYELFNVLGLQYGPAYRGLTRFQFGAAPDIGRFALAEVTLPACVREEADRYVLHPSVLDGALQATVAMALIDDDLRMMAPAAARLGLPFALEKLEIRRPSPATGFVFVRPSGGSSGGTQAGALPKLDIDVCDEAGQVCVRLSGFTSRVLDAARERESEPAAETLLFAPALAAKALPDTSGSATSPGEHRVLLDARLQPLLAELEAQLPWVKWSVLNGDGQACAQDRFTAAGEQALECVQQMLRSKQKDLLLQVLTVEGDGSSPLLPALGGLLRTAAREKPEFAGQIIEVPATSGASWIAQRVRENAAPAARGDGRVRYVDDVRHVWRLAELALPPAVPQVPWKDRGVYLITGGAGALGQILAQEILKHAKEATVILAGRSRLEEGRRLQVESLAKAFDDGSTVEYRVLDVSNQDAVAGCVEDIVRRHGTLSGVVHAAGVLRDSFLIRKTPGELREVFAPKVSGAVCLDRATGDLPLDFFILFSSMAAPLGNVGQADYAMANAFLDEYAVRRNAQVLAGERHGRTLCVAWPLWANGGMTVDEPTRATMKRAGHATLRTADGVDALYRAFSSGEQCVLVLTGEADKLRRLAAAVAGGGEIKAASASASGASRQDVDADELAAKTVEQLRNWLSGVLKQPAAEIDPDHEFDRFGIDSILAIAMVEAMEGAVGPLPKTLLFEYRSIAALADHLLETHREDLIAHFGLTAPAAVAAATVPVPVAMDSAAVNEGPTRFRVPAAAPEPEPPPAPRGTFDVAIVGVAGRYPGADSVEAFWKVLEEGRDCITEIPPGRWDYRDFFDSERGKAGRSYSKWGGFVDGIDEFDPLFFNISPHEALHMDPQERLFLQCVFHTLEDAGYTREQLKRYNASGLDGNVGVFVGVMYEEYQLYGAQAQVLGQPHALGGNASHIANRVSWYCGLHGPSMAVDTMCSSSLTAIHLACESLKSRGCEAAIAGGVNLSVHPNKYLLLAQGNFASSTGRCLSFGQGGDGYVPGEGVGAVLLKPLDRAVSDGDHIHAVIKGSSINHGGKTNGYTVPNPQAQAQLIVNALRAAQVDPRTLSYLEAHGTGTSLGDPIEIAGLTQAFAKFTPDTQFCAIGSVKSNIGHLESAAGIAALTKVLLQMRQGMLVPSLHSAVLNPYIDFERTPFRVQQALEPWRRPVLRIGGKEQECPRRAGISSFGAGGANAHLIVEEYIPTAMPERMQEVGSPRPVIILLSAKTAEALKERVRLLLSYTRTHECADRDLPDIAYTLQVGREEMDVRLAFTAATVGELQTRLEQCLEGNAERGEVADCYRGDVRKGREILAALKADEDTSGLIATWFGKGKFRKLLQLWVNGLPVDWAAFHRASGVPCRRVPLPVYPFAKERYWPESAKALVQPRGSSQSSGASGGVVHPLAQRNTSSLTEQRFSGHFSGEEPFLRDHRVGGERVLSATACLEMARAAVLASLDDRTGEVSIQLHDVEWTRPVIVAEPRDVHVGLRSQPDGDIEFQVYTQDEGDGEVLIASGVASVLGALPADRQVDLASLREKCAETVDAARCFEAVSENIQYGSGHRALRSAQVGRDRGQAFAVARIGLPESADALDDRLLLHPLVLDGALQASLALAGAGEAEAVRWEPGVVPTLPVALDRLEILHPCPASAWAYLRAGVDAAGSQQALDIDVCDDSGRVCVRFSGLALRASGQDVVADEPARDESHVPDEALPASAPAPAELDDAALGEKVLRRLKSLFGEISALNEERIDESEPLESYGIDSVMVLRLNEKLGAVFTALPKTLFYEYPSLSQVCACLVEEHRAECLAWVGVQEQPAPVVPVPERVPGVPSGSARKRARSRARQPVGRTGREKKRGGIAIIGLSGRYPQARNVREYWENLKAGKDCIVEIPSERWSLDGFFEPDMERALEQGKSYSKWGGFLEGFAEFDPLFFNLSPRDAYDTDPQERLFLQASWEALEDAGYSREGLARRHQGRVGVYAGITKTGFDLYGPALWQQGEVSFPQTSFGSLANRVSYLLDLHGPSMPIDTMCSASLTAIHEACEHLLREECELAIAGGVNLYLHPASYVVLCAQRMLSRDGQCKSFGAGGNGFVPGEGVGVVLLKPLETALADGDHIYGVIKGTSINHGGKTNGYTVPSPVSQRELVLSALKKADVDARAVSYVEAHGTGTALGDPIEIAGLSQAYGVHTQSKQYCAIGSAKSNIGHLESAAGIAGLTKVLLQMKHGELVPSLHAQELNANIDFTQTPFVVQRRLQPWRRPVLEVQGVSREYPRIAGVSSFGAGGSNAHVIVEEYIERRERAVMLPSEQRPALVVLSAKSDERLREQAAQLLEHLRRGEVSNEQLYDVAYTLQIGREGFEHRLGMSAVSVQDLQQKLSGWLDGKVVDDCYRGEVKKHKDTLSSFNQDEETSALVGKWAAKGKWGRLLELWAKGLGVAWWQLYEAGGMYGDVQPRRVSLPTYPFARERYWVDSQLLKTGGAGVQWLHPLVHRNTSSLEGQRFSTELNAESFYLRDHVVQGRRTLPGVCYLEMVRAGVLASLEDTPEIVLKNVVWPQALVVDGRREVHLGLQVDAAGEIEFEVYTLGAAGTSVGDAESQFAEARAGAGGTAAAGVGSEAAVPALATEVVVHAQGRVVLRGASRGDEALEQAAQRQRVDVEGLRSRSTRSVGRAECYEQFARMGLRYGESHRGVEQLYAGEDEHGRYVVGELRLPQAVASTHDEYVLHPSVLDSALQATVALLGEQDAGKALIPFALERVEILARTPARGWVCVRDASGGGRGRSDGTDAGGRAVGAGGVSAGGSGSGSGSGVRKLDLQVLDEAGWECVRLKGFSTRVLEAHAGNATDADYEPLDETLLLKKQWVEVETTDSAAWTGERLVWLAPAYEAHATQLNVPVRVLQGARVLEDASVRQLPSGEDVTDAQRPTDAWRPEDVCWEVLEHLRAVLQGRPKKPLWLQVVLGEQAGEALSAALAGLFKSAAQENPKIRGEVLRVPADVDGEQFRQLLSRSADGTEQRHVSGRREVARLQALAAAPAGEAVTPAGEAATPAAEESLAPAVAAPAFVAGRPASPATGPAVGPVRNSAAGPALKPWKNDGVYLLTGGAGGLGLIFAEEIARSVQSARLILTGRSALSDAREAQLQQLRELGAQVEYQAMDVSEREQVQACIRSLVERHGRLDGIVHSAGVLRDSYLIKKTEQEYRDVISAKILGARNLDAATQDLPLDCFILFGSTAGVFGNVGQSDYACANGWLDGYAQERNVRVSRGEASGRTLSIDWPLWAHGGMKVDEATLEAAHRLGIRELPTSAGIEALYAAWRSGESQVVVTCGPQPQLRQSLQLPPLGYSSASGARPGAQLVTNANGTGSVRHAGSAPGSASALRSANDWRSPEGIGSAQTPSPPQTQPSAPVQASVQTPSHPDSTSALQESSGAAALNDRLVQVLKEQISQQLKVAVADIDEDAQLTEFGYDSITLTALGNQLNRNFALELSPTVFFEYPTVRELAAHLCSEYREVLDPQLGVQPAQARSADPTAAQTAALAGPLTHATAGERRGEAASHGSTSGTVRTASSVHPSPAISTSAAGTSPAAALPAASRTQRNRRAWGRAYTPSAQQESQSPPSQPVPTGSAAPEPIAIIGMSGRFPGAPDLEQFWQNLHDGVDSIGEIPPERWDWREYYGDAQTGSNRTRIKWGGFIEGVDEFDPLFFGISPREAQLMDPQQRLLMTYAWKALEDAGYSAQSLSGSKTALLVGTGSTGYSELLWQSHPQIEAYSSTGAVPSVGPNRVSYFLNWHGPSEPIETACSSSLVAIHRAVGALHSGDCTLALVGGINTIVTPWAHISFSKAGMLSEDGRCKTFSAAANGYVRGEGVGMLLLKKRSAAEQDGDHIYGLILGSSENHGGRASSLTAPNPKAQAELIKAAYREARIEPATVTYVEAHGTGTSLGDPIEINALKQAFEELEGESGGRGAVCALGSVKTNIGHLELAAGVAGVIKVLLQMKHGVLAKSLHALPLNPYIQLGERFRVVSETQAWEALRDERGASLPRRAGVSSFGFGGVNAHVLLEEYVDRRERVVAEPTAHRPALVVLSARNEERLREQVRQLIVHLQAHPEQNLYDIAYTLQVGRDAMEHRLALSVVSTEELSARLNGWLSGEADRATCQGEVKKHRDALSSFNLDEETGRLIGKWVEKGKWGKLLEVWTKGLSVHWQQLYAPDGAYAHVQPRRLSLPTYAFARERCWVESSGSRATSGAAELHPLVHRNTSRLGEQRFSSTLSPRAFYLSDHVINGQRILPAVAFLEMARAAVLQSVETGLEPHADSVDIEDALWLRPLIVDSERDVQIALYPCDDGSIEFEVYTHDAAGEEVVHAQGRAQLKRAAGEPERIDLQALTCEAAFEAPKCYEAFSAMGIEYGPAHRALKTLQVGRDAAGQPVVLGHVELPGCVSETQESYVLHPSVLDATLQACIGLGLRDEERSSRGEALVPFALERIQVYKPSPRSGVALVRAAAGAGSTQKFDVLLCDEQGEVCVRLKGLSSRVLQSSTGVPSSRAVTQKPEESGKPVESSRSGGEKQVASAADDFREQAAHYLKKLLSGVLKLPPERIESDVGLEKYGIDSLMALKLVAGLEAGFGPLPKTLMFEYQSINELAGYFLEQHRDTLLALLKSGEASASSRSEGESDAAAAERARAAAPGQSKPEEDVSASLRTRSRRRARSAASGAVMRSSRDGGGALDIAIIGVSGRYPAARDLAEYWENLKAGRDCIMEVPEKRWDHSEYYEPGKGRPGKTYSKWGGFIDGVDEFDPQFFNISPREAVWMDPQERLFLQCAYETLEDAGYTRAALKSYKAGGLEGNVGVFVGVMYEEYQLYGAQAQALGQPYALCGNPSSIANRVSYFCNFHGPSMSLDTMCSGSLTAIHLACESLRNSGCELALAGGVNVTVHPNKYLMLSQGQFASSNGRCESFGKGGDGYVPGEGVGAVLLKPLAQAEADGDHIYAVIKGTSINHGGKTNGYTVPNPVAQAQVIARALKQSGVDARAISYIEAHGTGTSLGDPIEISGLTQAFSQYTQDSQYCAIGSAKSNIGHLESAAGIAGLTKVLLQMRHGQLAPSLHSQVLNPHIDFERTPFRVQQSLAEWQRPVLEVNGVKREFPRIAGISSFGAGGANAHVILQEYWHEARTGVPVSGERPALIVLSAKSEEQLREQARRLLAYVGQNALENAALYDLAYTLQVGREAFEYRLAFTAMTTQQLQEELTAYLEGRPSIDGCYRGEVERDREALSRLSSDADFSEVVTKWLQRGKYHSLLELWVKGLTFDWQRLYGEGSGYSTVKPRRMPLPTYPFARERCWIEPIAPSTAVVGTRWIHPLVHRNTSSLEGQRFSTELSAESFYLRDHVVQGRRTLPGVCYLEMVRAGVLASLEDSSEIVLKNVVWSQALVVEDRREVHLGLQVDSAGEIEFEVYTLGRGAGAREAGNKQAETQGRAEDTAAAGVSTEVDISAVATDVVVHAQGRVVLEQGAPRERVDVEALRSRSTRSVSRAECYEQFARVGLKYGESHQGVDQLHAGEDDHGRYVLGELRLPQAVSSTRDEYVLHPSVLDSALQATVALLGEQDAGKAAIPFAVERVEILARTPARGWVCVRDASGGGRIRSDGTDVDGRAVGAGGVSAGGSGSSVRRLDLQVLDEAGWECVRLKGFSTRVLEAHAGDATDAVPVPADATLLLKKQWVEVETTDGAAWTGERLVWLDPAYEAHAAPLNVPVRILQSARVLEDASVRQLTSGADATDAQRPTDAWRPDDVCWEVLEQLRSVLQGRPKKPLWLQVVLREQAGEALSAALAGLLKSATQENPKIRGEVLRVPADVDGEQLRQLLSRSADGTEQRHVSGRREVASLQALAAAPAAEAASAPVTEEALAPAVAAPAFVAGRLASPAHGPAVGPVRNSAAGPTLKPWKNDGVYLLTGGAGGLGLIFAEEIARSVQNARLILTGRSVLSDAREDQLQQLRDRGAQVEYQSMDVSDHEQVQACIRSIVERHGRLDGIVHSAGVLRDSYLIKKTEQEYRHVISAKILGARNLDAATQGLPLDCFILFASTSGVFGNIGQSDYACANGWLDGYAQERNVRVSRGEVSGRTLSIDWPLWADGGMKVDEATLEAAHSLGIWELSTRDGIDALYAAWRSGESQVVVTCGPQPQLRQALQLPLFDNASASATRPSTKLEESGSASVLFDKLVQLLKAQISQQLNLAVERIKIDVPLHELGYDSVALTSLRNQLHRTCGIELSPTIFFEYPTVRALATYLVAEQGAALSEKLGIKPQSTGSLAAQQLGGDITVPGRKLPDIGTGTGSGGPHAAEHTAEAAHAPNVTPAKAGRRRRRMERSSPAQDARGTHDEPIAIIGTSGRFPGASDVSQFWENLKSGTDCITAVPADRWDHSQFYSAVKDTPGKTACAWGGFLDGVNEFDPLFFNISPNQARQMDPQELLFLETVWILLESRGYTRAQLQNCVGNKVGVYVGSMYHAEYAGTRSSDSAAQPAMHCHSSIANRVSHFFGFYGPSVAVDTMCSSSTMAIHVACKDLLRGECDMAIAGGVNLTLHPDKYLMLSRSQMLGSSAHSRSFGDGDGYLPAECVGAVLLKRLSSVVPDEDEVLAVIRGSAASHAGNANAYAVPNPASQAALIEEVLRRAGVDARSISYVEASATGAAMADALEIKALQTVFGSAIRAGECAIGSVKSAIGHAEAASGVSQVVKVVEQLRHRQLAPIVMPEKLNPALQLEHTPFRLQTQLQPWKRSAAGWPRRALVNSFGAGGSYVSLLLEEHVTQPEVQKQAPGRAPEREEIIVLSARTDERVRAAAENLLRYLDSHPEVALNDLAYTLQVGREPMSSRVAWVIGSRQELHAALTSYLHGASAESAQPGTPRIFHSENSPQQDLQSLLSGNAGRALANSLIAERNLEQLARLWTQGVEIVWSGLHGVGTRKIALPTYPFRRERLDRPFGNDVPTQGGPQTGGTNSAPAGAPATAVRQYLEQFMARQLGTSAADLQDHRSLGEYGVDSLIGRRLIRGLEETFGLQLSGRQLQENSTLATLVPLVASLLQEQRSDSAVHEPIPVVSETHEPAEQRATLQLRFLEQLRASALSDEEIEQLIEQGSLV